MICLFYTHTQIHTHTHTRTHARTHTHTHTRARAHKHTHTKREREGERERFVICFPYTHTCTHIHMYTHTHARARVRARTPPAPRHTHTHRKHYSRVMLPSSVPFFSSAPRTTGRRGGHDRRFSTDPLPVVSARCHYEQFWQEQGQPLFDGIYLAFSLITKFCQTLVRILGPPSLSNTGTYIAGIKRYQVWADI